MTTEKLAALACLVSLAGCPLPPPPTPRPIDCEEIERAQERFPEQCGESDAGSEDDAEASPSDE
jgi:hypothetical protein